jgi:hypothetical protein
MRILVEGLDHTASIENVRVQIGETLIVPVQVGFLPGNAVHEVEAQLPAGTVPGPTSARVHFSKRQSPPVALEIK